MEHRGEPGHARMLLLPVALVVAAACSSPAPEGTAPPEEPPRGTTGTRDAASAEPLGAPTPLSTEASAQDTSLPTPTPTPLPAPPADQPSTTPQQPALPEPTTAGEWAELLPHFRFLAENGECSEISWSTPPCGPGMRPLAIMDEPPHGETNGYSVGFVRTLPRRASGGRLCVSSRVDVTGLFPVWEEASVRLDNALASAVKDLAREQVDCETFAEAQAEAARTGEPY